MQRGKEKGESRASPDEPHAVGSSSHSTFHRSSLLPPAATPSLVRAQRPCSSDDLRRRGAHVLPAPVYLRGAAPHASGGA